MVKRMYEINDGGGISMARTDDDPKTAPVVDSDAPLNSADTAPKAK